MKTSNRNKHIQGFTLVELLVTITIIGIIGSFATTRMLGATDQARATAKYTLAKEGTKLAASLFSSLGTGSNTPTNPLVHTSNSLEDVLLYGIGLSTTYQTPYTSRGFSYLADSIITMTEPVASTSKGVYHIGDNLSVITIITPSSNREMFWQFTNTTSSEVEYLVSKYDKGNTFNASTADTTGKIRYTAAAANGMHTTTVITRL
jgi:prepilin-type N-terminal cleavage/methylation domain-containing protein